MEDQLRVDPVNLFSEERRLAVQNQAYLGYDEETVEFCGHLYVMETIRPYMKYAISQVLEPYRNTVAEPDVWAALHVGVALKSIDRDTSFCPPTNESPADFVRARLFWLTGPKGYWQPTIDFLFGKYIEMEQKAASDIVELHHFAERSRDTSLPSLDSSIAQGPSSEETAGDTQPTEPSN